MQNAQTLPPACSESLPTTNSSKITGYHHHPYSKLFTAVKMAGNSPYFLFFALSLLSVVVFAHRPLVGEKHGTHIAPSGATKSPPNEVKIDPKRAVEKLSPESGDMNKVHDDKGKLEMEKKDGIGKRVENPGEMNRIHDEIGKSGMGFEKNGWKHEDGDDDDGDDDDLGKWEEQGDGDEEGTALYDVPSQDPTTYPGVDAGFHFGIGPIGIGFDGGLQWGANPGPVYVVPYNQPQPYVVISPYPYPQPGSGQGQPGSGYGGPQTGQGGQYGPNN